LSTWSSSLPFEFGVLLKLLQFLPLYNAEELSGRLSHSLEPQKSTSPVPLRSRWASSHGQTLDLLPVKGSETLCSQPRSTSSPTSLAPAHFSARLMASEHIWALPHGPPLFQSLHPSAEPLQKLGTTAFPS